jgi:hypothetical protein
MSTLEYAATLKKFSQDARQADDERATKRQLENLKKRFGVKS